MDNKNIHDRDLKKSESEVEAAITLRLEEFLINRAVSNRMEDRLFSLVNEGFGQVNTKRGLCLPTNFDRQVTMYENNLGFSRSFVEETKSNLHNLFSGKSFDLWTIRDVALIFLRSVKNTNKCFRRVGEKVYSWLNDDHVVLIANLVTAIYLEAWLIEDKNTYQTPYGFLEHPYRVEDKLQKGKGKRTSDGERSEIQRAFKQYNTHLELRKLQIAEEKTSPMMERNAGKSYGHPVDLITLAWCEAYINGKLDILDYLYSGKYIMTRAEDIRNKKDDGLSAACQNYQAYIEQIHQIQTHEQASVENHRRFVASSMLFHKIERVYSFHMQGRIAERRCAKTIDPRKYSPRNANYVFGRFAGAYNYLFQPLWTANKNPIELIERLHGKSQTEKENEYNFANERLDVLDIDFYINHMFCVDGEEQSYVEGELHWQRRCLAHDLIVFLFTLYPPTEQHSWQEEDFSKAATFYRFCYPITEEFLKVKFPDAKKRDLVIDEEFYSIFRYPYAELSRSVYGTLSEGRKQFGAKRKKANQGKSERKSQT